MLGDVYKAWDQMCAAISGDVVGYGYVVGCFQLCQDDLGKLGVQLCQGDGGAQLYQGDGGRGCSSCLRVLSLPW